MVHSVTRSIVRHLGAYEVTDFFSIHKEQLLSVYSSFYTLFFQESYRSLNIHMSRVMGKPTSCICENKDADQLRGNREADQRLCFRYIDSSIPLPSKSEISSL